MQKSTNRTLIFVLCCTLFGSDSSVAVPQVLPPDVSKLQLRVGFLRDGRYSIQAIPLETYVSRVLAGEAVRDSAPAALEALAVTVRTFALANRGRHRADGFDLCDQTHCQVVRAATTATDAAASATAGQVLVHNGALASIYYTASCGGRTELPSAVWPGADDPPYLPSRRDDACGGSPVWAAELTTDELERALQRAGFRGELRDLRIASRDSSGRAARLRLDGLTPNWISGQDLRVAVGRTIGWQHLKSTAFDLRSEGRGRNAVYQFNGHGSGHGVGMCVIGSARLAASGESVEKILARYFPGATIASPNRPLLASRREPAAPSLPTTPAPVVAPRSADVLLTLPDDDEGERGVLTPMVLSARDELARTLGVAAPRPVTVRVHPTVDDYTRATARPWFTSGVMIGTELHLAPLAMLRDSGMLERIIRREIARLLTEELLRDRPQWVRDGAALHFSTPGASGSGIRVSGKCPSGVELEQPASAGALANAYARARACFEKQIAAGKSWKDVK